MAKLKKTPFDQYNLDFSEYASRIGEKTIYTDYIARTYPGIVGWSLIDNTFNPSDAEQGIDKIIELRYNDRIERVTVQERFRRAKYARYRELTATEANHATGRKGDFHKLEADLYVYGYLADDLTWIEAIVVDVPTLKRLFRIEAIIPERSFYRRKQQTILGFPFDKLDQGGAILWHSRLLK